ncbi:cation-transporting P-type ATPase [Chloroflexus sp.]|uniref:cation-transporting P-type ATPase n=1 Tax=Chloroflexus sp. TaxID=1904827 RepID=UPI003A0FEB08
MNSIHTLTASAALAALDTGPQGRSQAEAERRLAQYGRNVIATQQGGADEAPPFPPGLPFDDKILAPPMIRECRRIPSMLTR